MKTTESIRCKECGHRVMYKPRTHRSEYYFHLDWEDADCLVVCRVTQFAWEFWLTLRFNSKPDSSKLLYNSHYWPSAPLKASTSVSFSSDFPMFVPPKHIYSMQIKSIAMLNTKIYTQHPRICAPIYYQGQQLVTVPTSLFNGTSD